MGYWSKLGDIANSASRLYKQQVAKGVSNAMIYGPRAAIGYAGYKAAQYYDDRIDRGLYPDRYRRPGYFSGYESYNVQKKRVYRKKKRPVQPFTRWKRKYRRMV